jgi:DNA-binding response OmpR family regulator
VASKTDGEVGVTKMPAPPLLRVLCIDDDSDACEMLTELVKLYGIECVSAGSANECWKKIGQQRFDLYVLDAWLPGLDGFELCRQIRSVDTSTPILFYSGAAYDTDKRMGIAAGANAYLVKPDIQGLLVTLSGWAEQARKPTRRKSVVLAGTDYRGNSGGAFAQTAGNQY